MDSVVGIDLGTTYSALARINEAGLPELVPNAEGEKITPSVVLFEGNTAVIGSVAQEALTTEPENVVQMVKRRMGSPWTFNHEGTELRPEQISALILRKVVQDAQEAIGPIEQAVITVPAHFNDAMRNATKIAGEMAGLDVLALVNEPTAAAIAFGLQKRIQNATIAVYDLGGGTFDVTVMQVAGGDLTVLATGGDEYLGGANFDSKLLEHFVAQFRAQLGIDITAPEESAPDELERITQEWLKRAERVKRDLTLRTHSSTSLTALGKTMRVEVTRDEFAAMCGVLMGDAEDYTLDTLNQAGVRTRDVDIALLVGGSTRMPMVREQVERIFGRPPNTSIHPDEAVALGAVLFGANRALRQGQQLAMPDSRRSYLGRLEITDVASHSLGVEAYNVRPSEGGHLYNAIVLHRNVPLPFSGSEIFETSVRNQTSIIIEVLEGEHAAVNLCRRIGQVTIRGLPPGRPAGMKVTVIMRYNENGILQVEAVDESTRIAAHTTIDRTEAIPEEAREYATTVVKQLVVE